MKPQKFIYIRAYHRMVTSYGTDQSKTKARVVCVCHWAIEQVGGWALPKSVGQARFLNFFHTVRNQTVLIGGAAMLNHIHNRWRYKTSQWVKLLELKQRTGFVIDIDSEAQDTVGEISRVVIDALSIRVSSDVLGLFDLGSH